MSARWSLGTRTPFQETLAPWQPCSSRVQHQLLADFPRAKDAVAVVHLGLQDVCEGGEAGDVALVHATGQGSIKNIACECTRKDSCPRGTFFKVYMLCGSRTCMGPKDREDFHFLSKRGIPPQISAKAGSRRVWLAAGTHACPSLPQVQV